LASSTDSEATIPQITRIITIAIKVNTKQNAEKYPTPASVLYQMRGKIIVKIIKAYSV